MSEPEGISYVLDTQKTDLRSDVKTTIGSYMTALVAKNAYMPDPGLSDTVQSKLRPTTAGGQSHAYTTANKVHDLELVSDSTVIFKPTIASFITKGTDGHAILADVESSKADSKAVKSVAAYLETQSSSPNKNFATIGGSNRTGTTLQSSFGKRTNSPETTLDELASIGEQLLLRATADFQTDAGTTTTSRSTIAKASLGNRRFPAGMMTPLGSGLGPSHADFVPDTRLSVGVQNSPSEPFIATSDDGMVKLARDMVEAMRDAAIAKVAMMGNVLGAGAPAAPTGPAMVPGSRSDSTTGIAADTQGFYRTKNDYGLALDRGIAIFFGISGDDPIRAGAEPGYYTTVARAVIRIIGDSNNSGLNATTTSTNMFGSQRAAAVMNIFAAIGDRALSIEALGQDSTQSRSAIDRIDDSPVTRISKSRDKGRALAWRTSVLPSSYLLPDQIITAFETFTGKSGGALLAGPAGAKMTMGSGNRLSADSVQKMETLLDSEYVPFYFHDLRTNEIVAFHAFLESLSDSYAVDYEKTDAYGRVDPVMVYSKTVRSVALEFNVVATNPADFDEMWWKINKLTTLLYPQWTEGRAVSATDGKFIQPFSQIPGSSPLIRMRLGDVLKSNYSRFNLARLFGLGGSNFDLGSSTDLTLIDSEQVTAVRSRMSQDPAAVGMEQGGYKTSEQAYLRPEPTGLGWLSVGGNAPALITTNSILVTFNDNGTITSASDGTAYTLYQVSVSDTEALASGIQVGPYYVPGHDNFTVYDDQVLISAGVTVLDENQSPDQIRSDIQNFFSPDSTATGGGNSIVRSFESTAGKGLAGVITSMGFEWLNATWELGPGQTAPKVCKIKLDFSPIHDIAPGLDSNGFNRAPIYGVGKATSIISPDIYAERADVEYRQRSFTADKARTASAG